MKGRTTMATSMLTTVDNPFNPFFQYEEWDLFDREKGYNSAALLSRVIITSDELSSTDQDLAIEEAIDLIIKENVSGAFKRITKNPKD